MFCKDKRPIKLREVRDDWEKNCSKKCVYNEKKGYRVPKALGSNVENGFGVIFLHANEIIMSALSAYQKQAFISVHVMLFLRSSSTFTNISTNFGTQTNKMHNSNHTKGRAER